MRESARQNNIQTSVFRHSAAPGGKWGFVWNTGLRPSHQANCALSSTTVSLCFLPQNA